MKIKINNPIKILLFILQTMHASRHSCRTTTKTAAAKAPVSLHPSSQHSISRQVANHSPNTSQSDYIDWCI